MERERVLRYIDQVILFCFCVLVIFLPIAHTETVRAFALGIPAGLWIIKAILCRRFLFVRTPMDLPILLFTLVAGLSVVTAVDPRYSLQEFIRKWMVGIGLFYMAVNNVRPEKMKYILGALLVGNVIMVGYGIIDFFREGGRILNFFREGEQIINRTVRAGSLHSGVGTFCTYLVTIIPYACIALFFLKRTAHRFALLILLSLNLFVLFLTYSPGSWFAIIVFALLTGWIFAPRKMFIPFLLLIGLIIFSGVQHKIPQYYDRLTASSAPPDFYNARWILARFSLEKIKENPFRMLGYGQRSFTKQYKEFVEKYRGYPMWHAHNTFLNMALQTGLQGLILFCFLLYRLLKYGHENAQREANSLRKFYLTASFLMVITFFVRNLSDDFFIDDSALLFWFLSGTVFAIEIQGLGKKEGVGGK